MARRTHARMARGKGLAAEEQQPLLLALGYGIENADMQAETDNVNMWPPEIRKGLTGFGCDEGIRDIRRIPP